MGIAIGKKGNAITRVRKMLGKSIEIVEHSDDLNEFIRNIFAPARLKNLTLMDKKDGKKVVIINVDERDKGLAIGKNGINIQKAKILARRHHGIDDILIR